MTVSEAIKELNMILEEATEDENSVCYVTSCDKEPLEMAIQSLKKQIPRNWIAEYLWDGDFAWKCPCCDELFVLMDGTPQDNEYNYCPNCGQAMAESKN